MKYKNHIIGGLIGFATGIVVMWFFGDNIKDKLGIGKFKPAGTQAK